MHNAKNLAGIYRYDTTPPKLNRLVSADDTQPPIDIHVRPDYLIAQTSRYYIKLMHNNQMHDINWHCDVSREEYVENPEKWAVGKTYRFMTFEHDDNNQAYCYLVHVEPEQVRVVRISQDKYNQIADDFSKAEQERLQAVHGMHR